LALPPKGADADLDGGVDAQRGVDLLAGGGQDEGHLALLSGSVHRLDQFAQNRFLLFFATHDVVAATHAHAGGPIEQFHEISFFRRIENLGSQYRIAACSPGYTCKSFDFPSAVAN
jgi:hypothetical protein